MKLTRNRYTILALLGLFSFKTNAQSWSSCGSGMDQTVYAMCADTVNNVVYAGGAFVKAGGVTVNHIAKWDGSTWSAMGMNMGTNYTMIGTNDTVMSLCMYQGNLYAGGHFTTAEGSAAPHLAMWNGSTWSAVETSMDGDVHAMAVYQGQLYASGEFTMIDGNSMNHIARWDGSAWSTVGVGLSDDAEALIVYQGNLYAGGDFFMSGTDSCKNMAMWNGTSWSQVGTGIATTSMMMNMGMPSMVHSLAICNGDLYAGGMFLSAGGMNCGNLAKWNGTSWAATGTVGSGMMSDDVTALCNYKGVLCVGGMFSSVGGQSMSNMAQCNGAVWTSLGMGANNAVFCMTQLNGTLYSGGSFTTAGGASNAYVSQFTGAAGILGWSATSNAGVSDIFPNPFHGNRATLQIDKGSVNEKSVLAICDLTGRQLAALSFEEMQKNKEGEYTFSMEKGIAPGSYLYLVLNEHQVVGRGKWIVQ